jgi:hypothetical protein
MLTWRLLVDWRKAERNAAGFAIPETWLFLHYYEALNALFRIENALRMFVYVVLKNARKLKWVDLQVSSDDGGESTIGAIAKRRLVQDERFGYLGYRIASPLMHLTTGELIRLIFADAYWPMFSEFFPASKEIAKTKLDEIGNVRNALAHFRPVKSDDVEVVKQNANQVLSGIETALANVLSTTAIVPSNTADAWYAPLRQVAGPCSSVTFRQSDNEKWVLVRLIYRCPLIGKAYIGAAYRKWSVLTLHAPSILRSAPSVLEHVVFATEQSFATDPKEEDPNFKQFIEFVFSRSTLNASHEAIKVDLEHVVTLITEETDLIREDNLARGKLVRVGEATTSKRNEYWSADTDGLRSRRGSEDPAEYWGERVSTEVNFVTSTTSYPWMPTDISDEEAVPF